MPPGALKIMPPELVVVRVMSRPEIVPKFENALPVPVAVILTLPFPVRVA